MGKRSLSMEINTKDRTKMGNHKEREFIPGVVGGVMKEILFLASERGMES